MDKRLCCWAFGSRCRDHCGSEKEGELTRVADARPRDGGESPEGERQQVLNRLDDPIEHSIRDPEVGRPHAEKTFILSDQRRANCGPWVAYCGSQPADV